jgi:hypothetical protein
VGDHLLVGIDMTVRTITCRILLVASTLAITGCVSPETTRSRGGGPGADVGNRPARVQLHGGSDPFWRTPDRIGPAGGPPAILDPARQARAYDTQR